MDLSSVPLVDNHAHALTRPQPETPEAFRANFTEAPSPEMARAFVGSAVQYRWALKQIARALDCDPTEESILARRGAIPLAEYAHTLLADINLAALLLDEGYPPPDEAYTSAEMAGMLGVPVGRILRLETFVAGLIVRCDRFEEVVAAFDAELDDLRAQGYIALKSIAAYRTGLAIEPVSVEMAQPAYSAIAAEARQSGFLRLASKPIIDFFVWRALGHAARQEVPIQFHTGYGDPDLDLRLASPLHLRPLFEEPRFAAAPIVLLHGSYPYSAEAAYLAAAYPNAYLDLSFSLPPLDVLTLRRITETALGVAPAGKLMVSSDGTRIPEHYYLGAIRARQVLGGVLDELIGAGELSAEEAFQTAGALLRENVVRVYRLAIPPKGQSIVLSARDSAIFAAAMIEPSTPNDSLRQAAQRHDRLIGPDR